MIKVILSFDTEDSVTPQSDDAAKIPSTCHVEERRERPFLPAE